MMRYFLWHNWKNSVGYYLVVWKEVCKLKNEGGIGDRRINKDLNRAFLSKWPWRFGDGENCLWRDFIVASGYIWVGVEVGLQKFIFLVWNQLLQKYYELIA